MFKLITAVSVALASASLAQPGAQTQKQTQHQPDGARQGQHRGESGQDHREGRREGMRDRMRQRMHDRFDADSDGRLSESERAAALAFRQDRMGERRARVLDRIQSKSLADLPEPVALALSEFDLDDNLRIDDDERLLLEIELDARVEAKKAEMLARHDTDNDGVLSQDERRAARDAKRAQRQHHRAEMLTKYDANADGALDKSERETLRAEQGPPPGDPLLRLFRPRPGPGAHGGPDSNRGPMGDRPRGPRHRQD